MSYDVVATGDTPAHIIYLIDASGSMALEMPGSGKRKIDAVGDLLEEIAKTMFRRSRKGRVIRNRYKIALYVYGNSVEADTYDSFIPISEFVERLPVFGDLKRAQTNTKAAFECARNLLQKTIPQMHHSPAPMVCHLTDGEYTEKYGNPTDVVEEIQSMCNPDGNVLVQNIYIGEKTLLKTPVTNVQQWQGVTAAHQLTDELDHDYARALYRMSSPFPTSYLNALQQEQYNIAPGASMLFPAESMEMVRLAFVTSGATGMAGYDAEAVVERDLPAEIDSDLPAEIDSDLPAEMEPKG